MQEQSNNQVQAKKEDSNALSPTVAESFKIATAFSKSTIIPKDYQGNAANCYIALDMAQRINASPMMIMQNLYIVNGRPAWSSQFIIATINKSGMFKTPLQYKIDGEGDNRGCIAWAISKDGTTCESLRVTIGLAKKEGWYQKNGSKWQTMPELMMRYRAASFFGKLYCPELLMGFQSQEEAIELSESEYTFEDVNANTIEKNANTGEVVTPPSASEAATKDEKATTKAKENKTIVEAVSEAKQETKPEKQDVVEEFKAKQKAAEQAKGLFDPYA